MFRLHKEGRQTLLIMGTISAIFISLTYVYLPRFFILCWVVIIGFYLFLISFFRNPTRKVPQEINVEKDVIAPADGKVVAIEEVSDDEFISGKWIQISIFMSPLNVHVNRHPVSGTVADYAYHPGRYLVAWHPKSSTENEHTSLLYNTGTQKLKLRQIAGAVARRIICYAETGDSVEMGEELGFIKFGSRVDILLPTDSTITVKINQKVKGNLDKIAVLPD